MPTPGIIGGGFTVTLPANLSGARKELRWIDKGLADILPYQLDATSFLASIGNDTIQTGTVEIVSSPPGLVFQPLVLGPTALSWTISGGVVTNPLADYLITVSFQTAGGYTVTRNIWLRVWPISPNASFSTDLILLEGPTGVGVYSIVLSTDGQHFVFTMTDGSTMQVSTSEIAALSFASFNGLPMQERKAFAEAVFAAADASLLPTTQPTS
jgi:hypothetical protein